MKNNYDLLMGYKPGTDLKYKSDGTPDYQSDSISSWTRDRRAGDVFWKDNPYATAGWFPVWSNSLAGQTADVAKQKGQVDPNKTAGGFTGVDYKYFTDLLDNMIKNGMPQIDLYRQNAQTSINKGAQSGENALAESLAQSGLYRSGALPMGVLNLEGQKANAMGNVEVQLAAQDQAFRQKALSNLLGLQDTGLAELGSNRSYSLGLNSLLSQLLNQQFLRDQANDNSSAWGDIFGKLISAGGQVGAGFATKSDRRLKENIKQVDKSQSGINVYEFNYIGRPQRFRGAMADEVEKINPEAVIEESGIKFLDYSKIDVDFQPVD